MQLNKRTYFLSSFIYTVINLCVKCESTILLYRNENGSSLNGNEKSKFSIGFAANKQHKQEKYAPGTVEKRTKIKTHIFHTNEKKR